MSRSPIHPAADILRHVRPVLLAAALILLAGTGLIVSRTAASESHAVPAPTLDEAPGPAITETAVLAGGCFWGVQGVFQHVEGVTSAVSGYAGGDRVAAQYEKVSTGTTGHAESVQLTFDPRKISYGRLLQIYFSVAHDPTELNRQGPDVGSQYRSAIFPTTDEQTRVARAYIAQLIQSHAFDSAIVTRIEVNRPFTAAEAYHQDFLARHPTYPYIVVNDMPKIDALQRLFPNVYRADPVLVATAGHTD